MGDLKGLIPKLMSRGTSRCVSCECVHGKPE